MPRVAGGQRARLPWSGAAGSVSEGRRDPEQVFCAVSGEKPFEGMVWG